jgi:peptidoglycan/LPS O-acetylase OafA/YrhL
VRAAGATVAAPADAPPVEPHARYLATRTFGSLDGLRALSILAVLWHHAPRDPAGSLVAGRGFLGVDLFFVLSGFLIVTLLLRERRRTGTISLSGFYARRALRIFPPYYLLLAVVAAVGWLKPGVGSAAIRADLPYAAAYLSNLVPLTSLLTITWSLAAEEQFYLLIPALERRLGRWVPWLLPGLWLLAVLPTFGLWPELHLPDFFRQTTFGPILLGVMLAHLLDHPAGFRAAARLLGLRGAPLVALGLVALLAANPAPDLSGAPRILIHLAMALLVGACVVAEDHALSPALRWWPLRRIGAVSYGLYLFHMLAWFGVNKAMQRLGLDSPGLFFAAYGLATWLIAEASFRGFESRVLKLKGRFAG